MRPPETRLASPGDLARMIVADTGAPIDAWAVAALLESRGIRDLDAREHYGDPDVFGLARRVHALAPAGRAGGAPEAPAQRAALPVGRLLVRGGFFVASLVIQLVGLGLLGYTQWASLDFTRAQASTVAVAAAASFLVTAGFGGALGYLAPYFSEPRQFHLMRRVTLLVLALALAAIAAGALALALIGTYAVAWPAGSLRSGLVYYALFGGSTVGVSLLYVLRRYVAMLGTSAIGIVVAALAHEGFGASIEHAQWAGIAASVGLAVAVGLRGLARLAARTGGDARFARLPRPWTLVRLAAPHFAFSTLYFATVLADRLVSWSAGDHPLPVWFQSHYELGLDWALVSVAAGLAFLEVTVAALARMLEDVQDEHAASDLRGHNRAFTRFWLRHAGAALGLLLGGVLLTVGGVQALDAVGLHAVADRLADPVTRRVFALTVTGYVLLGVGLANAIFLFSLVRPWTVVRASAVALAGGLVVGIALSRTHAYWWGAAGTTTSGLIFAGISAVAVWRTLRRADLHLYAAY